MVNLGTVTGQEVKKNRDGKVQVRLLQVQMTNAEDVQTVQYMPTAGEDAPPRNGDQVAVLEIGPGFKVALGVSDSVVPSAEPGERKTYSRDSQGAIAAFILLAKNGDIELNGNTNTLVRWGPLNTALQAMRTAINAAGAGKLDGSGAAFAVPLDLSLAEEPTVKIP